MSYSRTSDGCEGLCSMFSCRLWVFLLRVVFLFGGRVFPRPQTFPFLRVRQRCRTCSGTMWVTHGLFPLRPSTALLGMRLYFVLRFCQRYLTEGRFHLAETGISTTVVRMTKSQVMDILPNSVCSPKAFDCQLFYPYNFPSQPLSLDRTKESIHS